MLELHQVSKRFQDIEALCNISLSLKKGEVSLLLGPNGAGKTTLIRILAGLLGYDCGFLSLNGLEVPKRGALPYSIGYLGEGELLDPDLKVQTLLRFIGRLKGLDQSPQQVRDWARKFGIEHTLKRRISHLSSGHKQRVALAQCFLGNPDVLLLDEPGNSLDPAQYREFEKILLRERKDKIILLSTHRLLDIERIGDRLILLNEGRIMAQGRKEDLLHSMGAHTHKLVLERTDPSLSWSLIQSNYQFQTQDHRTFYFPHWNMPIQNQIFKLLSVRATPVNSLESFHQRIEDVFFEYLEKEKGKKT